ncbi:MAG TPA: 3D domain-containing protein [Phycisphaerales bacterium]|nr:3D domain-containing protein [Phycisphaerales bacterium]
MQTSDPTTSSPSERFGGPVVRSALLVGVAGMVALSAVVTKEAVSRATLGSLADVESVPASSERSVHMNVGLASIVEVSHKDPPTVRADVAPEAAVAPPTADISASDEGFADALDVRFFNGRPVRPARTIRMVVTAYSPDEKSCGPNACGMTSSVHHVSTNGMRLVAADSRVLPLGSMVSVPGYDEGKIVPVLDRGGAIKGKRLDVLFATDGAAMRWGVKTLDVVVWEYADNLPADDFRAIRDSRN